MSKWTPGPYTFEQCSRLDGTTVQEWTIETTGRDDDDEPTIIAGVFTSKRDAALLAAAPDLAEALAEIASTLDVESYPENGSLESRLGMIARAALAKARGEA